MNAIGEFRSQEARERYFEAYDRAMALSPPPEETLDVPTRHGTTRVYRFGQGDAPPIVLLPGLMATSACFWPLIPGLAARGPVYAVDTLGEAGRSVQKVPLKDNADRASCLDDVLAALDLAGVHLVGGSTGGWHAVNQAIHASDRLASISLLDATTVTAPFTKKVVWYGLLAGLLRKDWAWRRFLRWSAGADILDRPDAWLILTGIRSYRPKVPFQVLPDEDRLRALKVPVLALFGAKSVVHDSRAAAGRLRELLPEADVEVLPEAGHYSYLRPEDRDRIIERVLKFVHG